MPANPGAGERITAELLRDPRRTDAVIAAATGTGRNSVMAYRHRLEASGAIGPLPPSFRSRNPGAGQRARARLLSDPAGGNSEIARNARCTPQTVYAARKQLEASGSIPPHACGDPKPPPGSRPSRTRDAIAKLGPRASPRQVADAANVTIQMAWKALREARKAPRVPPHLARRGAACVTPEPQPGPPPCHRCPVLTFTECVIWSIGRPDLPGIFGGLTQRQRARLARAAKAPRKPPARVPRLLY